MSTGKKIGNKAIAFVVWLALALLATPIAVWAWFGFKWATLTVLAMFVLFALNSIRQARVLARKAKREGVPGETLSSAAKQHIQEWWNE